MKVFEAAEMAFANICSGGLRIRYKKSSVMAWLAALERHFEHPKQAAKRASTTAA